MTILETENSSKRVIELGVNTNTTKAGFMFLIVLTVACILVPRLIIFCATNYENCEAGNHNYGLYTEVYGQTVKECEHCQAYEFKEYLHQELFICRLVEKR